MIKILTFIIATFGISVFGFSQVNDSTLRAIDNYVAQIDSNENLVEGISEGEIVDNGKVIGGIETYNLYDNETKELFRIQDNISSDTIIEKTFYYKNGDLVYAHIELGVRKNNKYKPLFNQKLYFSSRKLVFNSLDNSNKGYASDIVYEEGMKHLKSHIEYYN